MQQKKELCTAARRQNRQRIPIMRVGNVAVLYRPKPEAEKVEAVDEGE